MLRSTTHDSAHQNLSQFPAQLLEGLEGCHLQTSHLGKLCVRENSAQFMVSLEFVQFDEASLDLRIEDHHLALFADKRPQFCLNGRKPSSFFCSINLPADVEEASMEAELINAKLEIRFARTRLNSSTEF